MRKNVAASVRQRLLNLSKERGEEFQYILTRYGLERFLYRLSRSRAKDRFVLKGAALFVVWTDTPHRATRDIDLLGYGDNSIPQMEQIFREICATEVEDDGLAFLSDTVRGQLISAEDEYMGLRLAFTAMLSGARIPIQVDIGFGDAVTPDPVMIRYPVLLDQQAPNVRAYRKETVVAEKFQAMVELGMGNSRMKDFFDLWVIGRTFDFDGDLLAQSIKATFERREAPLPNQVPIALTNAFATDPVKQTQWRAFVSRIQARGADRPNGLQEICAFLQIFLMPPASALAEGAAFRAVWSPGGPWREAPHQATT